MKLFKNFITIVFASALLNVNAQNKDVMNAFSQSYDYEANKKYDAAIKALIGAYDGSSYEMNLRLGWLNYANKNYKDAVSYYQKASQIMPAATEPLWAIINPFTATESWKDVEKTYLSIIKLDSKNATANYNLAMIYYYRKDYLNAKKYFDVSLNLSPFNYNNMLMSGWNNYFLGNKNEARTLFNKVLLYSPSDKSALEGLSLIK